MERERERERREFEARELASTPPQQHPPNQNASALPRVCNSGIILALSRVI